MAVVIDRWRRKDRATGSVVPTARNGQGLRYLSHFRDPSGREVTKAFALKRDAQRWLDEQTAQLMHGTFVHPTAAKTTVGEWCETWLSATPAGAPGQSGKPGSTSRRSRPLSATVRWPR
jgi:hypothetical protein